jgi:hypothetical protein
MKVFLPWVLHHANRFRSTDQLYEIKDLILTRYGKQIGYDIQKIEGKKCHSCGGTGWHTRYSNTYPYKPYDYDGCWHCIGGWYKLPKWVCLARITFGKYTFHKPLKREECVKNPFTEEAMGWKVMDQPVIKGYIEHTETAFGKWAFLILLILYKRKSLPLYWEELTRNLRNDWYWKGRKIKRLFTWQGFTLHKPKPYINHYIDLNGNANEDLPF